MAPQDFQEVKHEEKHTDGDEQEYHVIDGRGDAILVIASDTKLRVSSGVLANASEPLANLLVSSNFKEGKKRQEHLSKGNQQPFEVMLPDDDPQGMLLLCQLLHHRYPKNIPITSREELIGIAMLANKYLVRSQFGAMMGTMIMIPDELQKDFNAMVDYLTIAYLLESPTLFTKASDGLVRILKPEDNLWENYVASDIWNMLPENLASRFIGRC